MADKLNNRYLISDGLKFKLADSAQATALGLSWDNAPVLTDPQVSTFPTLVFAKSPSTNKVYLLQGTTKAPVESAELLKALSVMGSTGDVKDSILNGFTLAEPVNELVQDSAGVRYDIEDGQKILIPTEALATALGRRWANATVIATAQLNKITTAAFISGPTPNSKYFLSGGTKHLTNASMNTAMAKFGSTAKVSTDFLSKFTTGTPLGSLLKTTTDTWLISNNQRYKISQSQSTALGKDFATAVLVTPTQLTTIPAPILMKSSNSGPTYLVDDYTDRYPLATSQLANYAGFGTTGVVPASYLNSFALKTDPGRFVNCSSDSQHYYLVGSKRYRVADAVTAKAIAPAIFTETDVFGSLPTFTSSELAGFSVGSTTSYVTTYVKSTTGNYLIENGKRREVLDAASLASFANPVPAASVLSASNFSSLPLGNPIVSDNNLFKNRTTGSYGIYAGNTFFPLTQSLYDEIKLSASWRFTRSTGSLSSDSIAKLTQGSTISPIGTSSSVGYLLTATGKQTLTDIRNVIANPVAIPSAVISRIDAAPVPALTTPFAVRAADAKAPSYLIANAAKRLSLDAAETTAFLPMLASPDVQIWPQSAIDAIANSTTVIAPGTVVKVRESGNLYLIDGWAKGLRLNAKIAAAFNAKTPKVVTRAQLAGYNTSSVLDWQKLTCGQNTYLEDGGQLVQIDANAVAHWPGVGTAIDAKTCQRLAPNANHVGTLVSVGSKKFKLENKKLRLIRTADEYTTLSNGQTPAVVVSATLVAELPKGNPTSYVVVAKDTLYSVAVKFNTKRSTLRTLNHLTTDKLTVGQILILP